MIRRLVFPGLVALAAYYALFGGEYSAIELWEIRTETAEAVILVDELEETTAQLTERVALLESDDRALETLARESFGMIRDGEVLYRFADSGDEEDEGS